MLLFNLLSGSSWDIGGHTSLNLQATSLRPQQACVYDYGLERL